MDYNNGPCWSCIEKTCKNCPCAVCECDDSFYGRVVDTSLIKQAERNQYDCDKFIERLYKEANDFLMTIDDGSEQVLVEKWRGFPTGFKEKELEYWMDARHSKGYGYIYENVSV